MEYSKNYIFTDENFAKLRGIRNRMAELRHEREQISKAHHDAVSVLVKAEGKDIHVTLEEIRKLRDIYQSDIFALIAKMEGQEDALNALLPRCFTVYDLDLDGFRDCANGSCNGLYHPHDYPEDWDTDLCPDCQLGDVEYDEEEAR